jgi:hypothetical protein
MKKGFVTFCTENYINIINNLVESVIKFSKYDITVYCINFHYKHSSNRVKSKYINVNNPTLFNIMKIKILASLDAEYEYCQLLDCDMILTKEIDLIFDENKEKILSYEFPLFAKHPHNPFENPRIKENVLQVVKRYTDKIPKMKYVYASYLFIDNHKWFFKEVLDEMNLLQSSYLEDELIINSLLVKYQVDYDIGYNYLPNGTEGLINDYLNYNEQNSQELYETYLKYDCPVKFYMFHGHKCKDPAYIKNLIPKLQNR